jgi:hypothetical protein
MRSIFLKNRVKKHLALSVFSLRIQAGRDGFNEQVDGPSRRRPLS